MDLFIFLKWREAGRDDQAIDGMREKVVEKTKNELIEELKLFGVAYPKGK